MNRMYEDLAPYWPLVSEPGEYGAEAEHWRAALRAALGPGRHRILELGVGGGNNLSHLTADFDAVAVDRSDAMLDNSRRANPGVEHVVGDMRSVRLGRTFDAVLVHDAIGYLTTEADLAATFETARIHLRPGGAFVTAPDHYRETFREAELYHRTRTGGGVTLTHVSYDWDPDPTDTAVESVHLFLIREGANLRVVEDRHAMGLFPLATWLAAIERAGFDVSTRPYPVHDDGREAYLLVGRRR